MIVTVAPTGAVPDPRRFPTVPTVPEAIGVDVAKCAAAGASVVHVHVRDEHGGPVHRRDLYEATYAAIRAEVPEMIICATTSSRVGSAFPDRCSGFDVDAEVRPDLASLSLGSFNFPSTVSVNPPDEIVALLERMNALGVRPEFEVFDVGMIDTLHALVERGLVIGVPVVNLLLGNAGTAGARLDDLGTMIARLPAGTEWAVAGIGRWQRAMTLIAAAAGGNVRTGMEDNPRGSGDGWTNADAVQLASGAAQLAGRQVATIPDARARFGLA